MLAGFARASAATGQGGDPLTEGARLLAAGTGASTVTIWLRVGEALRPAASWPAAAGPVGSRADRLGTDVALPPPGAELVLHGSLEPGEPVVGRTTVLHAGELLGAVSITKQRTDAVSTIDDQVLTDVAAGLSLILQNRRLVAELADRVDALAASRQRIVSTQDEVQRKLGRDLRVGAGQRLQDCRTRLAALATEATTGGATRTAALIDQIGANTEAAIEVLHDFAGGVYPPVLEADGLLPALRVATAAAALPVMVQGTVGRRYPREVESAVYFSVLEAVQNAAKYSQASGVTVRLTDDGAELSLEVTDDGIGFDPGTVVRGTGLANITDRLDALGGALTITSSPGQGGILRGVLPVGVPVPA